MRCRMPHKVKLGGQIIEITYPERVFDGQEELAGICHGPTNKIEISRSDNNSRKLLKSTLWHEVLHFALYISGQTVTLEQQDIEREEGIVLTLETNLLPAIDWKAPMWKDWRLIEIIE